jgi:hypothetical protein
MKRTFLAPLLGIALLALPTQAQSNTFTHTAAQNGWSWTANTSLGSLIGVPDNTFQGQGTSEITLNGSPLNSGQVTSANMALTGDLNGYIPGPFGLQLATVNVANATFSTATDAFAIDGAGNFTTSWTVTFLTGTLSVTPLGGSASVTDLSGTSADSAINSGSITINSAGDWLVDSDQTSSFSFVDAGTGISADFTIQGFFYGTAPVTSSGPGTAFCFGDGGGTACPCGNAGGSGEGCANDTGNGGLLSGTGSASIAANDLVLTATNLVSGPGLYFQGNNAINGGNGNPFGDGLRCAGGGVIRLEVKFANAANNFTSATTGSISGTGGVSAGQTKRYQLWYRDPSSTAPCQSGFNFTNGYEVTWGA